MVQVQLNNVKLLCINSWHRLFYVIIELTHIIQQYLEPQITLSHLNQKWNNNLNHIPMTYLTTVFVKTTSDCNFKVSKRNSSTRPIIGIPIEMNQHLL